jgi:hypothetical protein
VTSTFESRLRDTQQPKDIVATEGSRAATVATADEDDKDDEDTVAEDSALSADFDGTTRNTTTLAQLKRNEIGLK